MEGQHDLLCLVRGCHELDRKEFAELLVEFGNFITFNHYKHLMKRKDGAEMCEFQNMQKREEKNGQD